MTGLTVTVELRKVKCLCSYVKLIETPLGIDYAMFDKLGAGRCNWVAAPVLFLGGCVGECVHSPQNNPKESEIRSVPLQHNYNQRMCRFVCRHACTVSWFVQQTGLFVGFCSAVFTLLQYIFCAASTPLCLAQAFLRQICHDLLFILVFLIST